MLTRGAGGKGTGRGQHLSSAVKWKAHSLGAWASAVATRCRAGARAGARGILIAVVVAEAFTAMVLREPTACPVEARRRQLVPCSSWEATVHSL